MKRARCLVFMLAVFILSGCAGIQAGGSELKCPTIKIELYFGLSMPGGGVVSESDWKGFIDSQITPRFPDGLTAYDARGQWRDPRGDIISEGTKVVVLITENNKEKLLLADGIRDSYKKEFRQESVLLLTSCVNASF